MKNKIDNWINISLLALLICTTIFIAILSTRIISDRKTHKKEIVSDINNDYITMFGLIKNINTKDLGEVVIFNNNQQETYIKVYVDYLLLHEIVGKYKIEVIKNDIYLKLNE